MPYFFSHLHATNSQAELENEVDRLNNQLASYQQQIIQQEQQYVLDLKYLSPLIKCNNIG